MKLRDLTQEDIDQGERQLKSLREQASNTEKYLKLQQKIDNLVAQQRQLPTINLEAINQLEWFEEHLEEMKAEFKAQSTK